MQKIGTKAVQLLKAKPGTHFVFAFNESLPIQTCKRHGVTIVVHGRNKKLNLKFVTRL